MTSSIQSFCDRRNIHSVAKALNVASSMSCGQFQTDVIATSASQRGRICERSSFDMAPPLSRINERAASRSRPRREVCQLSRGRDAASAATLTVPSMLVVLVSAPPALMATFTASSIGSLKGTSIRSNPRASPSHGAPPDTWGTGCSGSGGQGTGQRRNMDRD